ncbi:ArgE/DapE family deacylase [Chloroflexi bacterium TSY]|nr:ArgE/DapE family deacylase [Chloroflexi bacterium TSY]
MTDLERRVLDHIDFPAMLQFLDDIVSIQSLGGTPAENEAQRVIATKLRDLDFEVDEWLIDFDTLKQHRSYSVEVERAEGVGVVGTWGKGNGQSLLFNGHTDVVPPGELDRWHFDPWRATLDETSGRVYGRGALDMKGGLCCAIFAVKAIMDAGVELDGRVLIESVIGEEDGGSGTLAAVVRGHQADAAVIMEPTELMIAPAQAGCFNFRVTIPGKAAHGAMRFEGVDPLEKFIHIYQAILEYERVRNSQVNHPMFRMYPAPYPICCGTIQAGNWASTVAESLTFEGRHGIEPGEDHGEARTAFETVIEKAASEDPWLQENPPVVEWWGGQFDPAEIPSEHPIVATAAQAFMDVTGRTTPIQGMTYGADMRLLVNDGGIPTILFGPGDVRLAHRPDESVALEDLKTCTRTLTLMVLRFCGVCQ